MNIQEIAKLAGVSPSTVSRVFNHSPKISREVCRRVLEVAEKHHYYPRLTDKQRNVLLLIPQESGYPAHYCVERLVIALSGELHNYNFHVEILPWSDKSTLLNKQFFAAAAIGMEPEIFADWNDDFNQALVILDRKIPANTQGVFQVSSDEFTAMADAVNHFKTNNLKKIGCLIYNAPDSSNAKLRFQAAFTALKNAGYPTDGELFSYVSEDNFIEKVDSMLKQNADALLCPGSSGGLLTAYALNLLGKKIPQDISIISTEVAFFSPYATPPHTTLSPDYQEMAKKVVEIFKASLTGNITKKVIEIPYRLIERNSVKKQQPQP